MVLAVMPPFFCAAVGAPGRVRKSGMETPLYALFVLLSVIRTP